MLVVETSPHLLAETSLLNVAIHSQQKNTVHVLNISVCKYLRQGGSSSSLLRGIFQKCRACGPEPARNCSKS